MAKLSTAEVKFYIEEARSCEERQRQELIHSNSYPLMVSFYEGFDRVDATSIHPHVSTKQRLAIINEYFPNTNAIIAEIMYKNPDIIVEAAKPQAEAEEGTMKAALQYGFDKADALTENRIALFDMLYAGYSPVEVDHLTEENTKGQFKMIPDEEEMQQRDTSLVQKAVNKFRRGKKATNAEEAEEDLAKEKPPEETEYATNEMTYVRRWNPLDVPLDWRARRLKDRRYNLKKVWMSRADFVVKYPKFKDRAVTESEGFRFSHHSHTIHSSHSERVLLYEFQVKKQNNEYWNIIVSPHITNEEIDIFKRPYVTNGFNMKIGTLHKYGKLYPRSMAQINRKMQEEMNNYVRHQMDVAERNIPKRIADKNKVKGDAIEALNSTKVNDLALVDGNPNAALVAAPHTNVSIENKELFGLFQDQKNKLWSVQEARVGGRSVPKFAEELKIQTAGFETKQIDIQEGLRALIKEELETFKDIIVNFWDEPVFLKITGLPKPKWYEPAIDPNTGKVLNPLADLLTGDYFVKVDISSALRPNKIQKRNDAIQFLQLFFQPGVLELFQSQGKTLNIEEIAKIAKEFGLTPETLFIPFQPPPMMPPGAEGALPPVAGAAPPAGVV